MHVSFLRRVSAAFIDMSWRTRLGVAAILAVLIIGTASLVYATGGIRFAYSHFMYVPIVLGGIAFGVPGGLLTAIAGGLALGPFMAINTDSGEMQEPLNWIYRIIFFMLIGALVGSWSQLFRHHVRELEWLHEHHPGTGLLNATGLLKQVDAILDRPGADRELVVAVIQLSSILEIQNTFGSGFARRVLAAVVARTRSMLPEHALVALIQPDQLATVVAGAEAPQLSRTQLEEAIAESYIVDEVPIHVEASTGVASYPQHASSGEVLVQKASIAMHWAVTNRTPLAVYDPAKDRTSRDNLMLLGAIPTAIERSELEVWHQAKLALATGQIGGTEALLRWNHPTRGYVQPGSFIPQLEETQLINAVTHVVIEQALAAAGTWRAAGFRLRVSINLSVRNLLNRTLLDILERHRLANHLQPEDIELEITESAVMSDPETCIRLIQGFRDRGYGVAIDDFGVGHSSLSYLRKLRVSALKIDQEFVKTLATDENNQKIVRAILLLADSLDLETVAEGVEDEGSLALLREWGCDYAQGYFVHRPAPPDQVSTFLTEHGRHGTQEVRA